MIGERERMFSLRYSLIKVLNLDETDLELSESRDDRM